MVAFTHLCSKVNISLAQNTITFYQKNNVNLDQSILLLKDRFRELKAEPISIFYNHPDHPLYHNDSFNRNLIHYHLKFPFNLDGQKLNDLLTISIELDLISAAEKQSFLSVYKEVADRSEQRMWQELDKLEAKAQELQQKAILNPNKFQAAANAALELCKTLRSDTHDYLNDKSLLAYENYEEKCRAALEKATPHLEAHRGYKKILGNITAAILGLGVLYLAVATINYIRTSGKHFFFNFETDSMSKVEHVKEARAGLLRI